VLDPSIPEQLVEIARTRLAAGAGDDEVLGLLRQRGLGKRDCVLVIRAATGMTINEARQLVHDSPVWADHREADERIEEALWRALFIMCVLDGGQIDGPDESEEPEEAAECRERRQRAAAQLRAVAAGLPDEALTGYRKAVAGDRLGQAFAALVAAGERHEKPDRFWLALWEAARTLCLDELLDEPPDGNEPADDALPEITAAWAVRRRVADYP
jgi:hypothetical protein